MIIDVEKIKRCGKGHEDFSFDYAADNSLVSLPDACFEGAVKVEGEVILPLEGGILVNATITFTVKGACSRCLAPATQTVTADFEEEFTQDGADDTYTYNHGIIDLTKLVNDNIIMNMPMTLSCGENCKGISY